MDLHRILTMLENYHDDRMIFQQQNPNGNYVDHFTTDFKKVLLGEVFDQVYANCNQMLMHGQIENYMQYKVRPIYHNIHEHITHTKPFLAEVCFPLLETFRLRLKERGYNIPKYSPDNDEFTPVEVNANDIIQQHLHFLTQENIMRQNEYSFLIKAIGSYFTDHKITNKIKQPLFTVKGNKKRIASHLGLLYRQLSNNKIEKDYLQLIKNILSEFKDEVLDSEDYTKTNLYKYLTAKESN